MTDLIVYAFILLIPPGMVVGTLWSIGVAELLKTWLVIQLYWAVLVWLLSLVEDKQ